MLELQVSPESVAVMLELQVSPARLPQPQAGRSHAGATGEPCPPPTATGWSQSCWSYRWALPASHSHRLVAVMLELQVSPARLPQPQAGRSHAGATGEPCPPPTATGWSQSCWSYRWALPASHSHRLVAVMLELQVSPARLPQPQAGRSHAGATGAPCPPPTATGWSQSCWSYRWALSLSQSCWSYRWALPASHSHRLVAVMLELQVSPESVAVMLELQVSPACLPQPQAGRSCSQNNFLRKNGLPCFRVSRFLCVFSLPEASSRVRPVCGEAGLHHAARLVQVGGALSLCDTWRTP